MSTSTVRSKFSDNGSPRINPITTPEDERIAQGVSKKVNGERDWTLVKRIGAVGIGLLLAFSLLFPSVVLMSQIDEANEKLDHANAEIERLTRKNDQLQEELNTLRNQVTRLRTQVRELGGTPTS